MSQPEKHNGDNSGAELRRKRRARNIALGLVLAGLVVLFYVISIVKMGGGS